MPTSFASQHCSRGRHAGELLLLITASLNNMADGPACSSDESASVVLTALSLSLSLWHTYYCTHTYIYTTFQTFGVGFFYFILCSLRLHCFNQQIQWILQYYEILLQIKMTVFVLTKLNFQQSVLQSSVSCDTSEIILIWAVLLNIFVKSWYFVSGSFE